jgi:hypothetical protein
MLTRHVLELGDATFPDRIARGDLPVLVDF